ncbi:hypothetical protein D1872_194350 [compost metagenome]
MGSSLSSRSTAACPRSSEACEASMYAALAGASARAARAAAPEIKPSNTTGQRCAAAPRITPAKAAISRPPTLVSTSSASFASGWFTSNARQTTAILRVSPAIFTPVPRPTITSGSSPVRAHTTAALAVVFPMPSSPVTNSRVPPLTASATASAPAKTACSASVRSIAGPLAIFEVPMRTFRSTRFA